VRLWRKIWPMALRATIGGFRCPRHDGLVQ
jgi:hypothetical protein